MWKTAALSSIDTGTAVYGVFGDPVRHSRSPVMLNRAFAVAGVNAVYAAFHVLPGTLRQAVEGIRALGFGGVNVTLPHKVEVMEYLDEIDEGARFIGAVNTIVNDGGRLIGYNTDGIGYVRSLKEETGVSLAGKTLLVIGAGGAARGVVYALAQERPARIVIANRTAERARALAADFAATAALRVSAWMNWTTGRRKSTSSLIRRMQACPRTRRKCRWIRLGLDRACW
jgi:shikimate dehydrogenase